MAVRLRFLLPVVMAAAAFAVPAANAGLVGNLLGAGNCPSGGTTVFSPWSDYANYFLAPNGSFEFGSSGWALSGGAAVVEGNEPFLPTGTHSLSLPSGSSAMSPLVCLGPNQLFVRMFAADAGGADHGLRIRVVWYGLLNQVLGASDFATLAPGGGWLPSSKIDSSGGLQVPLLPVLGSTYARIQIAPLGAGSRWQIDDLFIDPWVNRIG